MPGWQAGSPTVAVTQGPARQACAGPGNTPGRACPAPTTLDSFLAERTQFGGRGAVLLLAPVWRNEPNLGPVWLGRDPAGRLFGELP
jgi:hypothetical protein